MKRLWTEDNVTLDGRFSHLESIPDPDQNQCRDHIPQSGSADMPRPTLRHAAEMGDGYIGAGSTPMNVFLEDIKSCPPTFRKQTRLSLALGDNLFRLREWFGAFYHKPEMADQVALSGSPEQIADQIIRLRDAGVIYILLNPVFDEETQMERICEQVLPQV